MNTQILLSLDEDENKIVEQFARGNSMSKANAIKSIILIYNSQILKEGDVVGKTET